MNESTPAADLLLRDLRWLRALARRLVRDPHLAEDAVQDTLVKAMERRPRDAGALRGWLASILRNTVRQERRGAARRQVREAGAARRSHAPSTLDVVAELSLHRRLVELVHELDEPYRTAILHRFLRGRKPREIARELDVPVKTVHTRIERGLARLRARLDRELGGEPGAWALALLPLTRWRPGAALLSGLGSLVIPMNLKLLAAGVGLVLLGALVYLPLASEPRPGGETDTHAAPPRGALLTRPDAPEDDVETALASADRRAPSTAEKPLEVAAPVPPVATFEGAVRELDGRPVAGITVVFEEEREPDFVRRDDAPEATTRTDGTFTLPVPGRAGRLTVASPSYASVVRPYLGGGAPAEPPVVVVAPGRAYSGRVIDEDGQPVENALVEVSLEGSWLQALSIDGAPVHVVLPFAERRTDPFGEFEFASVGLVEGAFLQASRDGYAAARLDLPVRSRHDLELVLAREAPEGATVHGVVLDANGMGVADAHVSLGWSSVRTDAEGRFALPLEKWQQAGMLRAVKPGHLPTAVPFERGAADSGMDPERPLRLFLGDRPRTIRGRVLDSGGRPVAGVTVWSPETTYFGRVQYPLGEGSILGEVTVEELVTERCGIGPSARSIETTTDGDGGFELPGLLPREYTLFALRADDLAAAGPVVARADDEDVVLRLEVGEKHRVAGRVVSRGGVPLAGVEVFSGRSFAWERPPERMEREWAGSPIIAPSASRLFLERPAAVTDADGRFELAPIAVERAFLHFSGSSVLLGGHHVIAPTDPLEELEIEVEACCRFRVSLDDPEEADAVYQVGAAGRLAPLFVRVEGGTISMAELELIGGRSGVAMIGEGEHTLVLKKDGVDVRRVEVTFAPVGIKEIHP